MLRRYHSDYSLSCCLPVSHAAGERASSPCYCLSLFLWKCLLVLSMITSLELHACFKLMINPQILELTTYIQEILFVGRNSQVVVSNETWQEAKGIPSSWINFMSDWRKWITHMRRIFYFKLSIDDGKSRQGSRWHLILRLITEFYQQSYSQYFNLH